MQAGGQRLLGRLGRGGVACEERAERSLVQRGSPRRRYLFVQRLADQLVAVLVPARYAFA